MTIFRKAKAVLTFALCSSIAFGVAAKKADELNQSDRKTLLYIGIAACNNGEVTTHPDHKGCGTKKIGYTIDDASAVPADDYIKVYAGNDTMNNEMVSPDPDHKGGSTKSIGYLSKKPIPHGDQIFKGDASCNMGEATESTMHKGCKAVPLGYALPLQ